MTPERLQEIQARCEAATGDEWDWFDMGNGPILATRRHGRLIVMDFVRKGMQSAQPRFAKRERYAGGIMYDADNIDIDAHPDCNFIAHARQDLPDCIAEIGRLRGELRRFEFIFSNKRSKPFRLLHDIARKALEGTDAGD